MQMLRITLLAISLIGLTGWVSLRKRHSPVDDLPAIANTAFQIHAPTPQAGLALAEAARGWRGVTAATYNPASDLLVVIYTDETNEQTLQSGFQTLVSRPIEKKDFDTPGAPKCPVPTGVLTALPGIFLAVGASALAMLLLLIYWRRQTVPGA